MTLEEEKREIQSIMDENRIKFESELQQLEQQISENSQDPNIDAKLDQKKMVCFFFSIYSLLSSVRRD